ncbi:MAG: hypothetical protein AAB296_07785, partial [Candidatus Desantisbacteria bacterium]
MKKVILMLGILTISPMIIISCGTAKKEIKETTVQEQSRDISNELANAPKWVLDTSVEKGVAVGSAKIGKAGMQFART